MTFSELLKNVGIILVSFRELQNKGTKNQKNGYFDIENPFLLENDKLSKYRDTTRSYWLLHCFCVNKSV